VFELLLDEQPQLVGVRHYDCAPSLVDTSLARIIVRPRYSRLS
jgi:hypothetical protein